MLKIFKQIDKLDKLLTTALIKSRKIPFINIFRIFTESARGYSWVCYVVLLNILIFFNISLFTKQSLLLKAMFCPLFAWFLGKIVKMAVNRKRPVQGMENFTALTHSPLNDSFPSLHAASTTSLFIGLYLTDHPYAQVIGVWALIVTVSRLYLGVHYLSDLVGGILLGFLAGSLILFLPDTLSLF